MKDCTNSSSKNAVVAISVPPEVSERDRLKFHCTSFVCIDKTCKRDYNSPHLGCEHKVCACKFRSRSELVAHIRSHTGEKPLACRWHGCENRYSHSSNIRPHEKRCRYNPYTNLKLISIEAIRYNLKVKDNFELFIKWKSKNSKEKEIKTSWEPIFGIYIIAEQKVKEHIDKSQLGFTKEKQAHLNNLLVRYIELKKANDPTMR